MTHQDFNPGTLAPWPDEPAALDLDQESAQLTAAARALALAPRSLETYRAQWELFTAWCAGRNLPPLPATTAAVMTWLAERWRGGASVATLRLAQAAIRWAHRHAGLADPTNAPGVGDFLRGVGRLEAQSDVETGLNRAALTADADLVRAMLDAIAASSSPEPIRFRDAALVATAYTTAGRRSELSALTVSDAEADGPEYRLLIRRGKGDQLGAGRTAGVINSRSIPAADHLRRWITHHPLAGASAPLFVQLHRSGSCPYPVALSSEGIVRRVTHWGEIAGQPGLSGHSTRRGAATDAARAGAREVDLMRLGGWKSPAMPARYVAAADALRHHPLRTV